MMLLAKSNPPKTLKEHIDDALKIKEMLKKAFPTIEKISYTNNLWELLNTAIVFHDIGKAHIEFQKLLYGLKNEWEFQRHELFSLPFIKSLNINETELIYLIVAGHHKDFETLIQHLESYGSEDYFGLDVSGTEEIDTFEKEFENNISVDKVLKLLKSYGFDFKLPIIHDPRKHLKQFIAGHLKNKNEQIKLILLAGA